MIIVLLSFGFVLAECSKKFEAEDVTKDGEFINVEEMTLWDENKYGYFDAYTGRAYDYCLGSDMVNEIKCNQEYEYLEYIRLDCEFGCKSVEFDGVEVGRCLKEGEDEVLGEGEVSTGNQVTPTRRINRELVREVGEFTFKGFDYSKRARCFYESDDGYDLETAGYITCSGATMGDACFMNNGVMNIREFVRDFTFCEGSCDGSFDIPVLNTEVTLYYEDVSCPGSCFYDENGFAYCNATVEEEEEEVQVETTPRKGFFARLFTGRFFL